jgi:hypothetical protein
MTLLTWRTFARELKSPRPDYREVVATAGGGNRSSNISGSVGKDLIEIYELMT